MALLIAIGFLSYTYYHKKLKAKSQRDVSFMQLNKLERATA